MEKDAVQLHYRSVVTGVLDFIEAGAGSAASVTEAERAHETEVIVRSRELADIDAAWHGILESPYNEVTPSEYLRVLRELLLKSTEVIGTRVANSGDVALKAVAFTILSAWWQDYPDADFRASLGNTLRLVGRERDFGIPIYQ